MPNNAGILAIISQLEQKIKITKTTNPRRQALELVRDSLLLAKNDWDINRFTRVLEQMNRIPFLVTEGIFSVQKDQVKLLGTLAAQDARRPAPAEYLQLENSLPIPELSKRDVDFFLNTHRRIETLCNQKKPWVYSYPTSGNNEITHEQIRLWQEKINQPSDDPHRAYRELTHDYMIQGAQASTHAEVTEKLNILVALTKHSETEQKLLTSWLAAHGGQDNNRIIDYLFESGEFSKGRSYQILQAQSLFANWHISNNGKICLNLDIQYFSLFNIEKNMRLLTPLDDQSILIDTFADMPKQKDLAPLMQAQIKIELTIEDNMVKPKVTELKINSYTRHLITPDPIILRKSSPSI